MFCEGENENIVNYFSKFEGKDNFVKLNNELKKLSKFKYHGDLVLGELKIPNIGPSERLNKFHLKIKKHWGEEAANEVKYIIKYYSGDPVENIEELFIVIDIVITTEEDNKNNFIILKDALLNSKEIDMEFLIELLKSKNIIYNSIAAFIFTILDQEDLHQ